MKILLNILKGIGLTILSALSCAVTLALLAQLFLALGTGASTAKVQNPATDDIRAKFDMFFTNSLSDALDGVLSIRKVYWLSDEELVAPEPDPASYGTADSPAELAWLLEQAAPLLEGQDTYFDPDTTPLMDGTQIRYYYDETILVLTWKELHDSSVYTFSEVKIADPSQFRRFLAGGEYGSEKKFFTTEMAQSVNAVVASSGDFYRFRQVGASVYDGTVYRADTAYTDTCYIDVNGDLHFSYAGELPSKAAAQAFVDEHSIRFSLAFGPILVDDGVQCAPKRYHLGEIDDHYARAGLGQLDRLHYILATANTSRFYQAVPTIYQFADNMQRTGCHKVYALDGGQTAAIAMDGELINEVVGGTQRKISDIIYFATAIPDGG